MSILFELVPTREVAKSGAGTLQAAPRSEIMLHMLGPHTHAHAHVLVLSTENGHIT